MMSKKKSGFGKLLLGAGIGAGLGLLFAPKAGKETRKELKVKLDDMLIKIQDVDIEEVKYMCSKFKGIRNVYYIEDKYDLLGKKIVRLMQKTRYITIY